MSTTEGQPAIADIGEYHAGSKMTLPGKGEQPASCGEWYPSEFCDSCGEPHLGRSRCLNRSCPECWWKWSRDRAASITERLAAARHAGLWDQTEDHRCPAVAHTVNDCPDCYTDRVRCPDSGTHGHRVDDCRDCYTRRVRCDAAEHTVDDCPDCGEVAVDEPSEGLKKRAIHGHVSAPEGAVETLEDVREGFGKANAIAQEHGVRGAVLLFHGYRLTDEAEAMYDRAEDPGKKWAWVREHHRDWQTLTEWSPHWHFIGLCHDFEAAEDRADGWVIQNLRSLDRFEVDDAEGYEDIYGTAKYLLSHTSFDPEDSVDSIRWYGELHGSNFNPDPTDSDRALSSPLSREAWENITEHVERLAGPDDADDRGDGPASFECENCGGESSSSIFQAGMALRDEGWCDRIGREQQRRLKVAFQWAIGERKPPPGRQRPQTEEEATAIFEDMLAGEI